MDSDLAVLLVLALSKSAALSTLSISDIIVLLRLDISDSKVLVGRLLGIDREKCRESYIRAFYGARVS